MRFTVDQTGIFGRVVFVFDLDGVAATTAREVLRLRWPSDEQPTVEQAKGIARHNRQECVRARRMFKRASRFYATPAL